MSLDGVAVVLTAITALGGAFAWFMAWRERKRTESTESYRAVHQLYDQMVASRFEHPEFLKYARDWNSEVMTLVYRQANETERDWARYYTYVELCIGFANAVLQAHDCGAMDDDVFDKQWGRLVKLVVAEHYPIIAEFISEGPYVSQYLRDFIDREQTQNDWDWAGAHDSLTW